MKDDRDPQAIGEALLKTGLDSKASASKRYDNILAGLMFRNYGESETNYAQRVASYHRKLRFTASTK